MTKILEARAVISGEDRLSGVLDKVNGKIRQMGKGAAISADVDRLNKALASTKSQLEAIAKVNAAQSKLATSKLGLSGAQAEADRVAASLAVARKAGDAKATAELVAQQRSAQRAVSQASGAVQRQARSVSEARRALNDFGAPVTNLAAHERALRENVERTTAAIQTQTKAERERVRTSEARQLRLQRRGEEVERRAAATKLAAETETRRRASAGGDLMRGMGTVGRGQLDHIEAERRAAAQSRRVADGMSAPARAARDARERAIQEAADRQAESQRRREERKAAKPDKNLGPVAGAFGAGAAAAAYKEAAAFDRRMTMIGQTADASRAEIDGLGASVHDLAQQTATPVDKLAGGLEALVAQGRNLKESMGFLPSVAKTAAASGSEVEDIAKTADSVGTNFEIAGRQMQKAFDIMAAGGKAGQFELKDMARYLPSLGPAASAIGFKGEKGLSDLVAMLQVMRKGSGTAEEAVSSMNNILAKMESDKTTKNFKALGVDSEAAFKKARKEGRNLVEVFEELVNTALKGDRSRLGEIIDDMEFKRGVQALMSYRGEWQKLSQTLRDTSGGTVLRDLVQVTKDSQAGIDRLGNSWKRFTQGAMRAADAGGASAGLGELGKELETIAAGLERINKAYEEGGLSGALGQAARDFADRRKDVQKAWLDHRGSQEDGRIAELEAARDAHRKKLEAEGRPAAEIDGAMKMREAEIQRARRRKAAVDKARGAPELADKTPLRMGVDPTAPIQGTPGPIGPGIAGFQQAFPVDLNPSKPLPKVTPLPPQRPVTLPRTIGSIDEVLNPGGEQGPGTFTRDRAPIPLPRPLDFGGKTVPVEVVSLPNAGTPAGDKPARPETRTAPTPGDRPSIPPPRSLDLGGKTVPVEVVAPSERDSVAKTMPGSDPAKGFPTEYQASRGLLSDLLRGLEQRTQQLPGFGAGAKTMPGEMSDKRLVPDQRLEATVKPDQITAKAEPVTVTGQADANVKVESMITLQVDADWVKATARSEARSVVASIPLTSSGARPGAVSMSGAASTPGTR